MQDIFAAFGREGVQVQAYDEIGIVGEERCKLIVYLLLIELQLVELGKLEREVLVRIVVYGGGVGRIVDRAVSLNERLACKQFLIFVVLGYGNIEITSDALFSGKLQMGLLAVVDKLLQGLLQVFENTLVRA